MMSYWPLWECCYWFKLIQDTGRGLLIWNKGKVKSYRNVLNRLGYRYHTHTRKVTEIAALCFLSSALSSAAVRGASESAPSLRQNVPEQQLPGTSQNWTHCRSPRCKNQSARCTEPGLAALTELPGAGPAAPARSTARRGANPAPCALLLTQPALFSTHPHAFQILEGRVNNFFFLSQDTFEDIGVYRASLLNSSVS